ncbi:MAG TPA: four helix bundle protein [Candidatus Paceibacterota bacterium]|uniref:Four helix bundle protein n=1 Tax=Candidatus Wildermuthbacteria bacterium RIFCSPHIGHO2_02_FULL_49_9 TaxID=1802456 RepID=A0A1G2RD20_9BACT|nr:MAG: four helix bundle protein [Candidatus Wildermuthbacteria bacterium RIFCSPHIGHO2_02_FULL_49_9]
MPENKKFDLQDRTLAFTRAVHQLVNKLPRTVTNIETSKQLVRSAGSVGANYIEANESLSKKDFVMRIKICRKEAKESEYWLTLLEDEKLNDELVRLRDEAVQFRKIFGAIIEKCKV